MFGDDKLQRAIDAQSKIGVLLLEQYNSLSTLVGDLQNRLVTAETEHLGFKYALAALATTIRQSSSENRDTLTTLLDFAIKGLPTSLRDNEEFCAGITALQDEKTFSVKLVSSSSHTRHESKL